MAKTIQEPKLGQFVYRTGQPLNAGRVVGTVEEFKTGTQRALVYWLAGNVETVNLTSLRDLQALIDDHQKKLDTHKSTLEKLKNMK
jgi:hypothetical protein